MHPKDYFEKVVLLYLLVICCLYSSNNNHSIIVSGSPITNPLKPDGDVGNIIPDYFDSNTKDKKHYHNRTPSNNITAEEIKHRLVTKSKSSKFKLLWSTVVGSPIYSTPVIFPNSKTGKKQIFINTYYEYAEMLNSDGTKSWGWPLSFEGSSFQSSPILYDVDGDDNIDMGIADKNGNLFWVRIGEYGEYLEDYHIQIPKLKIKRDWATGIDPQFSDSFVMTSLFDRSHSQEEVKTSKARPDDLKTITNAAKDPKLGSFDKTKVHSRRLLETTTEEHIETTTTEEEGNNDYVVPDFGEEGLPHGDALGDDFTAQKARLGAYYMYGGGREGSSESLQHGIQEAGAAADEGRPEQVSLEENSIDPGGAEELKLQQEMEEQLSQEEQEEEEQEMRDGTYEYGYRRPPGARASAHRHDYGYMNHVYGGSSFNDSEYVMVDAHMLASPVLADINGDGNMEVVFSVSYYFDKADYVDKEVDFDLDMYVAGGIACWDLNEQYWTWLVHLDLTTTKSKYQAMIYAPPTVIDIDGDGRNEVIVGTALGLLYVLDGDSGFVRRFFPIQFNSIQAQVAVGDLLGDRHLEMIVVDMGGTVAAVNLDGEIIWDAHLSGTLPFPATLGDVNGDGLIDVIVVAAVITDSGKRGSYIYALSGETGKTLPGYPISLPGNADISAPIILVDLNDATAKERFSKSNITELFTGKNRKEKSFSNPLIFDDPFSMNFPSDNKKQSTSREEQDKTTAAASSGLPSAGTAISGLHMIITSFDGNIYIMDGSSSSSGKINSIFPHINNRNSLTGFYTERIDVGEHIYSVPLIDDITGDGYLDLLVGTLNGQMALFESTIPFHPVNTWSSFPKHRLNGFTHAEMGISIPFEEKEKLKQYDIKGNNAIFIIFDIWDTSYWKPSMASIIESGSIHYRVSISRGTDRLEPLWMKEFKKPGRYLAEVPIEPPELSLLVISMTTEHGSYFEDTVHISISTKFYIWIKYMISFPIFLLSGILMYRFQM